MNKKEFGAQIKNVDLVQKKRLQIAMGASKLFIKKGYFKTSMRDISKFTGITIGNLYNYITRKEDILYLVFDVFHSMWIRKLEECGVFKIEDPVEQLRFAVKKMLKLGNNYREMILLMYTESKSLPKDFLKIILKNESRLVKCFEEILNRGMKKRVFKIENPFLLANIIVFLLALQPLRGWNLRKRYQVKEVDKYIVDFILNKIS